MKKLVLLLLVLLLSACSATQQTDTGVTISSKVDPHVYNIEIVMEQDVLSYSQDHGRISGSSYNGIGSVSGVFWQDGKGIVRGTLKSSVPAPAFCKVGDTVVIKTTDWKVTGLIPGDTILFACTADFEPVCAKNEESSIKTGVCEDTWEFDFCRLKQITPAKKPTP